MLTIKLCTRWKRFTCPHRFEADSWLLANISSFGCLGDPRCVYYWVICQTAIVTLSGSHFSRLTASWEKFISGHAYVLLPAVISPPESQISFINVD